MEYVFFAVVLKIWKRKEKEDRNIHFKSDKISDKNIEYQLKQLLKKEKSFAIVQNRSFLLLCFITVTCPEKWRVL